MDSSTAVLASVGAVVDSREIHTCNSCRFRATADRMWNPSRKFTDGKLVVFCRQCAKGAVQEGITLYRLSGTLLIDAERKARSFNSTSIFAAIARKQREEEERVKARTQAPTRLVGAC